MSTAGAMVRDDFGMAMRVWVPRLGFLEVDGMKERVDEVWEEERRSLLL